MARLASLAGYFVLTSPPRAGRNKQQPTNNDMGKHTQDNYWTEDEDRSYWLYLTRTGGTRAPEREEGQQAGLALDGEEV